MWPQPELEEEERESRQGHIKKSEAVGLARGKESEAKDPAYKEN